MRNNKQNSVEWLIEQMFEQGYFDVNKPLTFTNLDHLQEQAKAMRKEETEASYADGYSEGYKRALELVEWGIEQAKGKL